MARNASAPVEDAPAANEEPIAMYDIAVNLEGVSTEYQARERGSYEARCTDVEPRVGQTSGQPYLNVEFTLIGEGQSGKVWNSYSLQPQAIWRLKGDMIKMGVDAGDLETQLTVNELIDYMVNKDVILNLDVEHYNDRDGQPKTRNKVASVQPIGSTSGYASTSRSF